MLQTTGVLEDAPDSFWEVGTERYTADRYNWKTHNPSFSENPQSLTNLIDSFLFSHQPTWEASMHIFLLRETEQFVH